MNFICFFCLWSLSPLTFQGGFVTVLPTTLWERWKPGPGPGSEVCSLTRGVFSLHCRSWSWCWLPKINPAQVLRMAVPGLCSSPSSDSQFEQWVWRTLICLGPAFLLSHEIPSSLISAECRWKIFVFPSSLSDKRHCNAPTASFSKSVFTPVSGHNWGTALEQAH